LFNRPGDALNHFHHGVTSMGIGAWPRVAELVHLTMAIAGQVSVELLSQASPSFATIREVRVRLLEAHEL
jgi:hypothetical protein